MANKKSNKNIRGLGWAALLLFFAASGFAQTQRGKIEGRVVDSSDAVVVGAKIEVKSPELGVTLETTTNEEGLYAVPYLRYGTYNVSVNAGGFKPYNVNNVLVVTATTTTVNVQLNVAEVASEVNVEASNVILETTSPTVGNSIEEKLKDDLPVLNRRNPAQYITTSAGVQTAGQGTIGGGRYQTNNLLLDGQSPETNINQTGEAGGPALPSVESIGEFNLLLNAIPAEYGRTGGPTIIFATKSGTNAFHGAVYDYIQNYALDARPWEAARRDLVQQHYYGIAGGGPVIIPGLYSGKNKTFFFADYSDLRTRSAGSTTGVTTVPTDAMRRGDFSAQDILPIYDILAPYTDASGNPRRRQFPGNQIPADRFSNVTKFFMNLMPRPTGPGSINNFVGVVSPSKSTQWLLAVKGDHHLSQNDRISGYYQGSKPSSVNGSVLGDSFGNESRTNFNRVRLDWSHIYSPSFSHQLLYGITRQYFTSQPRNFGENLGQLAGLVGTRDPNCPRIEINRAQEGGFNFCNALGGATAVTNQTVNYSIIINRGRHTIKTGFDFIRFNTNQNSRSVGTFNPSGYYNFGGLPPRPTVYGVRNTTADTDNTGGNSFADFILGLPNVAHVADPVNLGHRQAYYAGFVQDDWKVTPRLTINAGLRWDINVPFSEIHGKITTFDATRPNPGAAGRPGALIFYGTGPGRAGRNRPGDIHWNKVAPRLGFAYQLNDKTVVRAFGGIIFAPIQNTNATFADRTGFQAAGEPRLPADRFGLYYKWDTPFPQDVLGNIPNTDPAFRNGQGGQSYSPRGLGRPPEVYMYSLGFQREMPGNILFEATYLSTQSRHLHDRLQLNYLPEQYWGLGSLLNRPLNSPEVVAAGFRAPYQGFDDRQALFQALRPFPQYLDLTEDATFGTSGSYHAGIVKAQKRFSNGLSFLVNYTVSKFMTDSQWAPGGFGSFPSIPGNRKEDKGLYRFDVPQRLALSYTYQLPFGRGRKFLANSNKVAEAIVGGWEISGLHQYQAGPPASFSGTFNPTIPTIGGRANRIANVPTRSSLSCSELEFGNPAKNYLFNAGNPAQAARTGRPLAFAPAGDFQTGNTPRIDPEARQCGYLNEDVVLTKSFRFTETVRFQLGAEAYNLLNRHTWQSGFNSQAVTGPNFGEILPSQPFGPRRVQLKLRLEW
ncbi:MAG: TonB-dependent receptor [Acidobacteria bacterium]|nr:TonB-dependent receptor [Acidobacteriota bacterium]